MGFEWKVIIVGTAFFQAFTIALLMATRFHLTRRIAVMDAEIKNARGLWAGRNL